MARGRQVARAIRLAVKLSIRPRSIMELMNEMDPTCPHYKIECQHKKMVKRDVDVLCEAGIPVFETEVPYAGKVYLGYGVDEHFMRRFT